MFTPLKSSPESRSPQLLTLAPGSVSSVLQVSPTPGFLQDFTPAPAQLSGRQTCSPPPSDQPVSPSSYCWEEIQGLLFGRVQCFKTVLVPKWNKTKTEFSL